VHPHVGPEPARLDADARRAGLANGGIVRALSVLGGHRLVEARAAAATQVAVERELAHEEEGSADLGEASRHLPPLLEYAEPDDLGEDPRAVFVGVALAETEVREEAAIDGADDLAFDLDARAQDPLHHRPHGIWMCSSRARRAVTSK
jgi:hypothetical protein